MLLASIRMMLLVSLQMKPCTTGMEIICTVKFLGNKSTGNYEAGQYNLGYYSGAGILFGKHLIDSFRFVAYMQFFVNAVNMLLYGAGGDG